jgi:hypothetical protein
MRKLVTSGPGTTSDRMLTGRSLDCRFRTVQKRSIKSGECLVVVWWRNKAYVDGEKAKSLYILLLNENKN